MIHARCPSTDARWLALAAAGLFILFACTPTTEASGSGERGAQVMIQAFVVETETPIFDTSYEALAAAARGDTSALLAAQEGAGGALADRLRAADANRRIHILAAPSLLAEAGQAAYVQSGLQIPVQTVTDGAVTVQFVNATLRLELTPTLLDGGDVALDVAVQKRFPDYGPLIDPEHGPVTVGGPALPIQTTEVRSRVVVKEGGTAVLGGIFETQPGRQGRGPELVVLITPRRFEL